MDFFTKKTFAILGTIAFLSGCQAASDSITTFHECVDAGYDIWEAQPLECHTPDGRIFVIE